MILGFKVELAGFAHLSEGPVIFIASSKWGIRMREVRHLFEQIVALCLQIPEAFFLPLLLTPQRLCFLDEWLPFFLWQFALHLPADLVAALATPASYIAALGSRRSHAARCERLAAMDRVQLIGTAPQKAAVVSFVIEGMHPHDVGTFLDQHAIAVRTGHHCAWPLMDRFKVDSTVRASMGAYNTIDEVDVFADALERIIEVFG
jgi:hypothetical protein